MAVHVRLKNEFTEDEKYHNLKADKKKKKKKRKEKETHTVQFAKL